MNSMNLYAIMLRTYEIVKKPAFPDYCQESDNLYAEHPIL